MIHFFKKKPFLRDLIPDDFIDIHSHLMPGIDDGAENIEDTSKLIKGLEKVGFKKFITTPHVMGEVWNNSRTQIEEKQHSTVAALTIPNIEPRFKAAAEYMIDGEFKELFTREPLLTLKDNYVLVEISYLSPPIQLYDILFELQVAGYQPVLAHPERYNFYHHSLSDYKKLKKVGCLFQLNLLSAVGYYGERVSKISDVLIEKGLIDFLGSDVHHIRHLECLQKKIVLKNHEHFSSLFQNNSFFDF
ncbi:tyrosine-protein phosphatase [Flavobacterium sp.]|uniref:tyrosine-protein phosphatase n=1 Tax=Flavobacterium sp. TaxID=239 RepID=UPI002FDA5108